MHQHIREVAIGGDPSVITEEVNEFLPNTCSCGSDLETGTTVTKWPPIPIQTDAATWLLTQTDGYVTLEVEPLNYSADGLTWRDVLGVTDPPLDESWYLGVVDDQLISRTEHSHRPIWNTTDFDPARVGQVLRAVPSRPKAVWDTSLAGIHDDYLAGHDITAGVGLPVGDGS